MSIDKQSLKGTEGKNCVEISPKGISYRNRLKEGKDQKQQNTKKKKAIKCDNCRT